MSQVAYDFERYIRLLEAYRNVRESLLESMKMEHEIRKTKREDERLELERRKAFINDFIEIGKYLVKLCATGLLAALALSNAGLMKEVLFYVSLGGIATGAIFLIVGLRFRSDIEEDYIKEVRNLSETYDESLGPLVEYTTAIKDEVVVLNEMVKIEQNAMIEKHPEMKNAILGSDEK